jgi:hypothetical protein
MEFADTPQHVLERTFYRKLFIRRYTLLIEKVQRHYSLDAAAVTVLQSRVLALDWIDGCIAKLEKRLQTRV